MKPKYNSKRMRLSTIIILSMAFVAVACEQPSELEQKREELAEKEKELSNLSSEVKKLQKQVEELDTTLKVDERTLVVAANPKKVHFKNYIEIPGRADSRQNIVISAEAMGSITKVNINEGQFVKKGQVIASIESNVLRNQMAELRTRLELADELYEKQKRLWEKKIGSEVQYLQAKNNKESLERNIGALRAQLNNSNITAPISGYLDRVFVREGQMVSMGAPAARIVDLNTIRVEVEVSERYIGDFEVGDTAEVYFNSIDKEFRIPIKTVGQVVNPDDRTFMVDMEIDNTDGKIKPNVLADVKIATYENPKAIVLPTSVIQQGKDGDFVFLAKDQQGLTAVKTSIKTGESYQGKSVILKGVNTKDLVVTTGGRSISDGEPIKLKK